MSRNARGLATASIAALAALGCAAPAQAAFNKTLNYSCEYPLIESHPLQVDITADIPSTWPAKTTTPAFKIDVVATTDVGTYQGMKLIQAASVEGESLAISTVKLPGGFDLEVAVPITVDKYTLPATEQPMVLSASGETPPLSFPTAGDASITVDQISLNLIAKKPDGTVKRLPPVNEDSDGNPDTFDVACVLDPASQDTTLANFTVTTSGGGTGDTQAPSAPGAPSASGITSSGATVSWAASTDNVGVTGYSVYAGSTKLADSTGTSATLTGLSPNTSYSLTVKAKDAAGNVSAASPVGTFKTSQSSDTQAPSKPSGLKGTGSGSSVSLSWNASTDNVGVTGYDVYKDGSKVSTVTGTSASVTGLAGSTAYKFKVVAKDAAGNSSAASDEVTVSTTAGTVVNYGYSLKGSATLKNLVKGTMPLNGSITAALALSTGDFTGVLDLKPTTANLTALGFLPVQARVEFTQGGPTTGTLKDGILTSNSKVRIRLPKVTTFGIELGGGSGCMARSLSFITLRSTPGKFFDPLDGGILTGTFSISDLVNCGFLTGIISPLTSGSGNTIAVNLTPNV